MICSFIGCRAVATYVQDFRHVCSSHLVEPERIYVDGKIKYKGIADRLVPPSRPDSFETKLFKTSKSGKSVYIRGQVSLLYIQKNLEKKIAVRVKGQFGTTSYYPERWD